MKKYKLLLQSGLTVEHYADNAERAFKHVQSYYNTKVVRIWDLSLPEGQQLVQIDGCYFCADDVL